MKKKLAVIVLSLCMGAAMAACSAKDVSTQGPAGQTKTGESRQEKETGSLEDNMAKGEEKNQEKEQEKEKEQEDVTRFIPVIGMEIEEYDGFEYLYQEMLMTESKENPETGKMENEKLGVFIPKGDYTSVNRDRASADKLGVDFCITLNPYIRYEQEDYLLNENLEYFMDYEYDEYYATDYKALEISEVESLSENAARATANYCYYDKWNDTYIPRYCTYYMLELDKDRTVLVEIEISSDEVTGKTEDLIAELETYYKFDIDWDKTKAEAKLADYLANGIGNAESFSTGYLLFDLPAGWERDDSYDFSEYVYAPGGDVYTAGCMVSISREYVGTEYNMDMFFEDMDFTQEFFTGLLDETAEDMEISGYGSTCLGDALQITFTLEEEGENIKQTVYCMMKNGYMYSLQTMIIAEKEGEIDIDAIAASILADGKAK